MHTADPTAWAAGDYTHVARLLAPLVERVVAATAPASGELVVDLACGSGNATRCAVDAGARVVAVDFVPRMLELARRVAPDAPVEWVCGDVRAVPLGAGVADAVVSTFGLVFAPDPPTVAAELARVLRPGGRLGLGVWAPPPDDHEATPLGDAVDRLLPGSLPERPDGTPHLHTDWGDPAVVGDWLAPGFVDVEVAHHPMTWEHHGDEVVAFLTRHSSVHAARFAALDAERRAQVRAELEDAAQASLDPDGMLREHATWALVTAARRP